MRPTALLLALALSVAACNGGSGATEDDASGVPDSTEETPAEATETAASASSPLGNVLVHDHDDDGTTPTDGTDVVLLFEPEDVATLYVQGEDDDTLAAHGSWSYADGELALSFATDQLTLDVTAPFDLGAEEVSLPFRLFDGGAAGESVWNRRPADPLDDIRPVFRAAVLDEIDPRVTEDAINRATAYAQAIIDLDHAGGSGRSCAAADPVRTVPVQATPLTNGIEVEYSDGTTAQALLFSWAPAPTAPLSLTTAALASDPRVHLDSLPNSHTQDDPATKDAVFIVPLKTGRINDWWDRLTNSARTTGVVGETVAGFDLKGAQEKLEGRGYSVAKYEDEKACVECLIKAFGEHATPGFVLYQSHGSSNGYLLAGDQLSTDDNWDAAHKKFLELQEKLRADGYGTLVDTPGALSMMSIETELKVPEGVVWFAAVGPAFWSWLQTEKSVDFSHSLFYAAACEIDNANAVRESIGARAFFGFKATIAPQLAGAILDYLVTQLARHTRSAEEAFYNIVRVVNTGEMIYAEDKALDGITPTDESGTQLIFTDPELFLFNGYASDGASSPLPYAMNGWFDTATLSQSQVWWLMFAARWNENVDEGVNNLVACNAEYWSQGDYGGLGSPFCNAANDGDLPTEADVGYATFLMSGSAALPSTATLPRYTLNEGA